VPRENWGQVSKYFIHTSHSKILRTFSPDSAHNFRLSILSDHSKNTVIKCFSFVSLFLGALINEVWTGYLKEVA